MKFLLIGINGRFTHSSLGLLYVRQQLLRFLPGCSCLLLERTINDPYYDLFCEAAAGGAAAVFLSAYVWNAHLVARLALDLARLLPRLPVVVGGPQAEHLFPPGSAPATLTVVRGEVEGLPPAFYHALQTATLAPLYQAEPGQQFSQPFCDQDAATGFPLRNIYYEGSRGCPFRCSYCLSARDTGVRLLAADQVCRDLDLLFDLGAKRIRFVDRTFNLDPERTLAIWRHILERTGGDRNTTFHFEMAPDRFTDEMFHFLQQAPPGLFEFELGIQSTNRRVLAGIDRVIDLCRSLDNIRTLADLATVHLHVDLILGLPFEDERSFLASFTRVFFLGAHQIQMGLLKVLPDTPLAHQADGWGMVRMSHPPYEVIATRWLEHGRLAHLYHFGNCVELFHNNRWFISIWRYLRDDRIDPVPLFQRLARMRREAGTAGLGQEALSGMLFQALSSAGVDEELCRELLVYDWLATGHQFLPEHLVPKETTLAGIKREMWRRLPQAIDGTYGAQSRDEFFKTTLFYPFSRKAASFLTGAAQPCVLAFAAQRADNLFRLQKVLVFADNGPTDGFFQGRDK